MAKNKPAYAPLPARALASDKLSALDLRVLGLVAHRDRFSKNGIGCFQKAKQMATILCCHEKSVQGRLVPPAVAGRVRELRRPRPST